MSTVRPSCPFKTTCARETWQFPANTVSKRSEQQIGKVRCPGCNGRFKLRAVYCNGPDELVAMRIPDHKIRVTRSKGPRRKITNTGRGR